MTKPIYFVMGAFGDVIAGLGIAMIHPSWSGSGRFIWYGMDSAVAELIRAQSFCESCEAVVETNPKRYHESVQQICIRLHPTDEGYRQYLSQVVLPKTGIKAEQLHLVHVGERAKRENKIHRWKNPQLPEHSRQWAREQFAEGNSRQRSYLLHPFSWQSNTRDRHWGPWTDAILWLLQETPHRYFLTGQNYPHKFRSDSLVDLIDKAPTNLEVLALADLCDGIISTTNCLTHWAAMTGKPSVAACVWCMSRKDYYFRRWVDVLPIHFVEFRDPLSEFKSRCKDLFAITRFGPHAWKPENNPGMLTSC